MIAQITGGSDLGEEAGGTEGLRAITHLPGIWCRTDSPVPVTSNVAIRHILPVISCSSCLHSASEVGWAYLFLSIEDVLRLDAAEAGSRAVVSAQPHQRVDVALLLLHLGCVLIGVRHR